MWFKPWFVVLKSSLVTFWRRLTRPIRKRHLQALQSLSEFYLSQKTLEGWRPSQEELKALRSLIRSPGWKIYSNRLRHLGAEILEFLSLAENQSEFLRRQGALQNYLRIYSLVEETIQFEEDGVEKYLERQIEEAKQRLREADPTLAEFLESQHR